MSLQPLAEKMAAGLDVRFGALVTRVEWCADGVTVACADGQTFHADAAVVTVSFGVLKVSRAPCDDAVGPDVRL
jgi:monoamine oxidase